MNTAAKYYTTERLLNGFILVTHKRSRLTGVYNSDGTQRSGDLPFNYDIIDLVKAM